MLNKKDQRIRRSQQTRKRIAIQRVARLTVHRTNLHIYARVVSADGSKVLVSASTLEPEVRTQLAGAKGKGGTAAAAKLVGSRVAQKAKAAGDTGTAAGPERSFGMAHRHFPGSGTLPARPVA